MWGRGGTLPWYLAGDQGSQVPILTLQATFDPGLPQRYYLPDHLTLVHYSLFIYPTSLPIPSSPILPVHLPPVHLPTSSPAQYIKLPVHLPTT